MRFFKYVKILFLSGAISLTTACGSNVTKPNVASISLNKTYAEVVIGKTMQIVASVYPDNSLDKTLKWESSNISVATVYDGLINGISLGECTISASSVQNPNIKAICNIKVVNLNIESITLDKTYAEVVVGRTIELNHTILPADATDKSIVWSSSKESVATVTAGIVSGISEGQCIITASSLANPNIKATCNINVYNYPVASLELDKSSLTIYAGRTSEVKVSIYPEDATNKNIIWSSSKESVATVNDGVITGVAVGECTITAASVSNPNVTDNCFITVIDVPVESISLSKLNIEIGEGKKYFLDATVLPLDAKNKNVVWLSSDETIATVNEGLITAVAPGDCQIIVTSVSNPDITATCTVKILSASSAYVIASIKRNKLLTTFENNKKEKENKEEEFINKTNTLKVGTDNAFNIRPSLEVYDEDDNKVDDTLWPYDYVVEVFKKDGNEFVKASDTYYEVTNPKDASIQFKTTAEGSTFKIAITPGKKGGEKYKDSAKFTQEAIVDVVNGYNITDALDLAVFDTRGRGAEFDEYPTDSEADYGNPEGSFDTKWYEFKEERGIENLSADNFVFLNNVSVTTKDIPSTFVYETNQETAAIGSLKDPMYIYRRQCSENTKIYGNYFTLDYSKLPLVVRANGHKSTAIENRLDSHSTLFRLGKAGLTIDDLNIIGNGIRAVKEEDKKFSGSLMLVKTYNEALYFKMNNCLCHKAYVTLMNQTSVDGFVFDGQINQSKMFENYKCFLYNYGGNITVTDSVMKNAGGPVAIADHILNEVECDPVVLNLQTGFYTIEGNQSNTKFINSDIDSRVIGTEAWFDMMSATSITPQIKQLSDLLAQKAAYITAEGAVSKTYITDVTGNPVVGQMYQGTTVMSMLAIGKSNAILNVADLPCKGVPQFTFKDENSNLVIDYEMTEFVDVPVAGMTPFFELYRGVRNAGVPIFITSGGYAVAIPSDPANILESTWSLYDLVEYAEYSLGVTGAPTELNAASDFFAKADNYISLNYQGLNLTMKLFDICIPC